MPFITSADIARALGASVGRVGHILDSRGVRPRGRAGTVRLYDEVALEFIRGELALIDRWRGRSGESRALNQLAGREVR